MKIVLSLALIMSPAAFTAPAHALRATAAQQAQSPATLGNKDVLDLFKAGLSSDVIIAKIKSSNVAFDTSPAALQELKSAGLPDPVILAMVEASAPPKPSAETGASAVAPDAKATIYFYRIKQFAGSALEPSVFCDDQELARMDNGRYFGVKLDPGKHTCRTGDKQTGFEFEAKPGQEYYARVSIEAGFWKGHGRLTLLAPEQGAFELKKVKPLSAAKVKDKSRVVIYEGSDAAQETRPTSDGKN